MHRDLERDSCKDVGLRVVESPCPGEIGFPAIAAARRKTPDAAYCVPQRDSRRKRVARFQPRQAMTTDIEISCGHGEHQAALEYASRLQRRPRKDLRGITQEVAPVEEEHQ